MQMLWKIMIYFSKFELEILCLELKKFGSLNALNDTAASLFTFIPLPTRFEQLDIFSL